MRTDGMHAFDEATRKELELLLRPRERSRAKKRKEYQERKAKPARLPRAIGRSTQCAHLWLEYLASAPQPRMTRRAFCKLHGVKEGTLSSAVYYITHPDALEVKQRRSRERVRELVAEVRRERRCPV